MVRIDQRYICKSLSYGINIKWPPGGATKLTWSYIQVYRSWMAMKPKVGKLVKWSSDMISKMFQNMPPPINQFWQVFMVLPAVWAPSRKILKFLSFDTWSTIWLLPGHVAFFNPSSSKSRKSSSDWVDSAWRKWRVAARAKAAFSTWNGPDNPSLTPWRLSGSVKLTGLFDWSNEHRSTTGIEAAIGCWDEKLVENEWNIPHLFAAISSIVFPKIEQWSYPNEVIQLIRPINRVNSVEFIARTLTGFSLVTIIGYD